MTDIVLPERLAGVEPVRSIRTPARIDYTFTAGVATSKFLRGLAEKKILGQRCPKCGKVYVPARGACPTDGVPTAEIVDLPHVGTVTTFCVVNVQFYGQAMELPYVSALILLDDSDIPLMHLIQEVAGGRRPHGPAGRGGVGARRRAGARRSRVHPLLPPQRRARRRLRDLQGQRLMTRPQEQMPKAPAGRLADRRAKQEDNV